MITARTFFVPVLACALLGAVPGAAPLSSLPQVQQANPSASDDPANELFVMMCNRCHDAARITATRRTRSEWEEVLVKMIEKGAAGSEDDFLTVLGYLRRHHGKVYINTATADEISTTLALSEKDGNAIVAYRKANGPFQDLDALKKVPEIDIKVLDSHKHAVAF